MTYDQWFRSQQGIPYECAYLFAEAAWDHQQKQIAELTRQRDLAVEALEKANEGIKAELSDNWTGLNPSIGEDVQTCSKPGC